MYYDSELIKKAEDLRKNGSLYSEISNLLGVPKSTIYGWTKDIELCGEQRLVLAKSLHRSQMLRIKNLAISNKQLHLVRDQKLAKAARVTVATINLQQADKQLLCSILYWCEGGKDISGGLRFINSDPVMISTFLALLRDSFSINESKFRALIHLHEYHDASVQLEYWSRITKIPIAQFHKSYLKPNTGKNYRKDYPGCVSIRYMDRNVGKLLQMIYTEFGSRYRGVR